MEESGSDFAGFQICVHKYELVFRKSLSRLQRRAPGPLQVKPNASLEHKAASQAMECNTLNSSSSSSAIAAATSSSSFYESKDPIPLLSPLVLPSLLGSSYLHQEGSTAK